MSRRLVLAWAIASMLPVVLLAATAAGAADQPSHIASYATTVIAGGLTSGGTVGASGGLVTIDSASAYIRARLDSGPSSAVVADPVEPGALVRTLVGQTVGQQTLPIPAAEAQYPGTGSSTLDVIPATAAGPLSTGAGSATAKAAATAASGQTTASTSELSGVYQGSGSYSTASLARTGDDLVAESSSGVSKLVVGPLTVAGVEGTASIKLIAGRRTSVAGITVGSASVAGTPVTIDGDGVHAAGQTLVPLGPVQQTTEQLNQQLAAAGVAVHLLEATNPVTATGASADSGGLVITVSSPPLPGGVAGNTLTLYAGRTVETESDSPEIPVPAVTFPPFVPAQTTTTTIYSGGDLGAPAPTAVGNQQAPARFVAIVGRRLTILEVLLAFALWQLLTLGGPTLTTLVRRRRRQRALGARL
ncbi:MAG TPA: hypothetical protein VNV65_08655 [Candidatus Solibacter sp.]|jgi:hypothetical protein|nr:hypothetical protein [Candidatus Solibacter sp.]